MKTKVVTTFFVYPFVNSNNDFELKCSMKSILKNFKGNAKFVVIGDKPNFSDIDFIYIKSERKSFRAIDITHKQQTIINDARIPNDFVWMYDDIYFINPVELSDLKKVYALQNFSAKPIDEWKFDASQKWVNMFKATMNSLTNEGKLPISYETHLPRLLNKKKLQQIIIKYDLFNRKLLFASLYYSNIKEPIYLKPKTDSVKLGIYMPFESLTILESKIKNNKFLNYSEKAFTNSMRQLLFNLFLK